MDGFATDMQGRLRMSDIDIRTGRFHQTQVTTGDTAQSMNYLKKARWPAGPLTFYFSWPV